MPNVLLSLKGSKDGVIFQTKANEKGKQIMGKGSLKKVACAKGKTSDEQTLAQMKEIGTKRLRGKEVSEEENTWAQRSFRGREYLGPKASL